MKVLFVFPEEFGLFPDIFEYCVLLKKAGFEVGYLGTSQSRTGQYIHDSGVCIFHLNQHHLPTLRITLKKMATAIDEIRPDFVHVFHFRGCGLLPLLTKSHINKWIVDIRSVQVEDKSGMPSKLNILKNRLTWLESQAYSQIVVINNDIRKLLKPSFRPIKVIPLGASKEKLNPVNKEALRISVRKKYGINITAPLILYAGAVSPARQLDKMVVALSLVKKKLPEVKLFFIGGQKNSQYLKNLILIAKKAGVDVNIIFINRLPYDQVHPYFCAADIGISYVPISSAYNSQTPTKLIEYMMAGLITVGTSTFASKELIRDGENGILCGDTPEETAQGLIRAIKCLPKSNQIIESARKHVEGFDWQIIVNKHLVPFYKEL